MTVSPDVRRYAGPVAFLLAATVAAFLIRGALRSGGAAPRAPSDTTRPAKRAPARRAKQPVRRYWAVRAGDTFGVIAARSGLTVAKVEALNPHVSSTALFIGEKIRTR